MEVHHLTYERIFNESMEDLLPLCWLHHKAAEHLIAEGRIPRKGNPLFLMAETVRLLAVTSTNRIKKRIRQQVHVTEEKVVNATPRNRIQEEILKEPWFGPALLLSRNQFRKVIHDQYDNHRLKNRMISNGFTLYDRIAKVEKQKAKQTNHIATLIAEHSADPF